MEFARLAAESSDVLEVDASSRVRRCEWALAERSRRKRARTEPREEERAAISAVPLTVEELASRSKRAARFVDVHDDDDAVPSTSMPADATFDEDESLWRVVGTSSKLEKAFFRLTAAPRARDVRPVDVLRASLLQVRERMTATAEYAHACEQLKSIRQDLRVQGVRGPFAAEVYECHARLALEQSDLNEFNQRACSVTFSVKKGISREEG